MVKVAAPVKLALASCLYAAVASATCINFINQCSYPIELYHSQSGSAAAKVADIAVGCTHNVEVDGPAHMYRNTANHSSTLLEMSIDSSVWYDISIIPPNPGYCSSYNECNQCDSEGNNCQKTGFNVPMKVEPKSKIGTGSCQVLDCPEGRCNDAYQFPKDDTKTHHCPAWTSFDVTFCSGGTQQTPDQPPKQGTVVAYPEPTTAAPTTLTPAWTAAPPTTFPELPDYTQTQQSSQSTEQSTTQWTGDLDVKSKYTYSGQNAGNVPGSYDRVVSLGSCSKESVQLNSPVGPMSEEVTMIFRGPCEIENIAVFSDEGSNGTWSKVSSYSRQDQTTDNLVFMNNKNIDYSGQNAHGPQGLATADGKEVATEPTVFNGVLDDALNPSTLGGGPGISTGVEVNIMTGQKCNGDCVGFAGSNDYHGWGGGKKAFVTEVKFPKGPTLNRPAIWMLNAQVVHSNQYGCNCRGMGPVGGCGELDIAEVIETNQACDKVTTHYYFYDGSVLSPGGDNFADRRFDTTTVYVTLIDDSNQGLIKIVELSSFDFSLTDLSSLYQKLVDC